MALTSVSKSKKAKPSAKAQPSAEDSSAFGQIAERFRRAGDLERAVSLCREGLQKSPDHVSARVTLGWALLELGKFDEAQGELETVLRKRPDNLAAIRALAELHDRAEQTMNLPMDGPGQWPPSPDQVDQMAGGMVADHFRAVSAEESIDPTSEDEAYSPKQAAVVPPAELGLAMWSALPATEQAEPEHLSIAPTSIVAAATEQAAAAAEAVSDADIAALLAEADSLDALESTVVPPVAAFESVETPRTAAHPPAVTGRATALADIAFDAIESDEEPAVVLDDQSDLDVLTAFATPTAPAARVEELTAFATEAAPVAAVELTAFATPAEPLAQPQAEELTAFAAPAEPLAQIPVDQVEELTAFAPDAVEPAGPVFQLESQSAIALESAPVALAAFEQAEVDVDAAALSAVAVAAQPVLRFDLEPTPAPVAAAAAVAIDAPALPAVAAEVEPVAPAAIVAQETIEESAMESAVIASVQARIAEVVAMARPEPAPARPKASVIALERLLGQVRSRRRMMAESVA
jgi:tetratricopeptide (TPR) repeat protein